jgi:hypothetical protein
MCFLHGAFANLPLYSTALFAVRLRDFPEWDAAMRRAKQDSQLAQPHHQVACSGEQISESLEVETDPAVRVGLILQWALAARVGCVLKLRRSCLEWDPFTRTLTAQFRHGKGVEFRGPYTVNTRIPQPYAAELEAYLAALAPDDLVVAAPAAGSLGDRMPRMLRAIRVADPLLNLRAVRRGALQTMSLAGVDAETLLLFSGHTSVQTLKRYLDWGRLFASAQQAGVAAASHLSVAPSSQH